MDHLLEAEAFKRAVYAFWARAVLQKLYPFLRLQWLQTHPSRLQHQNLESLLPLIVDGALRTPSGWMLPRGELQLLGPPGIPFRLSGVPEILVLLHLDPDVAPLFRNIVDIAAQHELLVAAERIQQIQNIARHNDPVFQAIAQWTRVIPNANCRQANTPFEDIRALVVRARLRARVVLGALPHERAINQASQLTSDVTSRTMNSLISLIDRSPVLSLPRSLFEPIIRYCQTNLDHLHAEAASNLHRIAGDGRMIRRQLREGLVRSGRLRYVQRTLQRGPLANVVPGVQQNQPHSEILPPQQLRYPSGQVQLNQQQRPINSISIAEDVNRLQISVEARASLVQSRLQELRSQRGHTQHLQSASGNGVSNKVTFGYAVQDFRRRIEKIKTLQERLSRSRNVLHRNESGLLQITREPQDIIHLEYLRVQRMSEGAMRTFQYHLEMHLFTLREALIILFRKQCPERSLSLLKKLEIWLLCGEEDLSEAARVHGSHSVVPLGWGFPPYPAELEFRPFEG